MTLTRTQHARQRLGVAIGLAANGHAAVAREQIRQVETTLRSRHVGRADLARALEDVLTSDVTAPESRTALREVAQKLDAELSPDVAACAFVVASDGGERL